MLEKECEKLNITVQEYFELNCNRNHNLCSPKGDLIALFVCMKLFYSAQYSSCN